jgi:hypothetical protein
MRSGFGKIHYHRGMIFTQFVLSMKTLAGLLVVVVQS